MAHRRGTRRLTRVGLGICLLAASSLSRPCALAAAETPDAAAGDRTTATLDARRRSLEASFPLFRGLRFRKPVQVEYLDRNRLRARLLSILDRESASGELLAQQKAFAAFGLLPVSMDLKQEMVGLHEEEVAGFYDPRTKKLYLIRETAKDGDPPDADSQKIVLLHEMSHALMDQYHDLTRLDRAAEKDDDMMLGLSGLIEGEATLAMLAGSNPEDAGRFLRLPPFLIDLLFGLMKPFLSFASGESFQRAPEILRESMLFPYLKGLPFCLSLTRQTGTWALVDAAFDHPPLSSEQILHPERYPTDVPRAVSVPGVASALGADWKPVYANVMGELQTRTLLAMALSPLDGAAAAEGWGGDFYRVYERKSAVKDAPRSLYVWVSAWDSQKDAREFREGCAKLLAAQLGSEPVTAAEGLALPAGMWARAWAGGESVSVVLGRDRLVWALRGIPRAALPGVLGRVLAVRLAPKRMELRPAAAPAGRGR